MNIDREYQPGKWCKVWSNPHVVKYIAMGFRYEQDDSLKVNYPDWFKLGLGGYLYMSKFTLSNYSRASEIPYSNLYKWRGEFEKGFKKEVKKVFTSEEIYNELRGRGLEK